VPGSAAGSPAKLTPIQMSSTYCTVAAFSSMSPSRGSTPGLRHPWLRLPPPQCSTLDVLYCLQQQVAVRNDLLGLALRLGTRAVLASLHSAWERGRLARKYCIEAADRSVTFIKLG